MGTLLNLGIVLILVILGGGFIIIWNGLVRLRKNIDKAWADIDVLLEKRHDQLGKLLDVVKGYTQYEKSIMTNITKMRTSWMNTQGKDEQTKMDASNQISQALKSIFAVAENYPDLKANTSFIQLQSAITDIESQIADRREFYNESVNEFNVKINQIPYDFFAGSLGYKQMPLFQVPEEEKQDVKMDFGKM